MSSSNIKVPSFKYTGMYYPQILQTLRQYRRVNVPEITSEDDHEPFEQCLRAYALASHISNVLADLVALESFLPTAQLLSSVRDHLKLIGYDLSLATPSQAEVLMELTKVFTTGAVLIPYRSQFATQSDAETDEIIFEYLENESGFSITQTDQLTTFFAGERTDPIDDETEVFVDGTSEVNSATGSAITPWATPDQADTFYIGHQEVMFDRIDITLESGGESVGIQGVWEYHDGDFLDTNPNIVEDNGGTLTFVVDNFLGQFERPTSEIKITYLPTGSVTTGYSAHDGSNNKVTTIVGENPLMGQSSPSLDPTDYSIGSIWNPLENVIDETNDLQNSGKVTFTLPKNATQDWVAGSVNSVSNMWVRYRIVKATTPTAPSIEHIEIDQGTQYVSVNVTQGETVQDTPLGSSNGLANQEFILKQDVLIEGSLEVQVGEPGVVWTQVDDFLSSESQDKHYTVRIDDDDSAIIKFGDGTYGAIPTLGVNNISAYYRIGANDNGNVAAGSITINEGGVSFVTGIINPRAANGWTIKDGGSEEDLERIKVAGPATLRTLGRAVSVGDIEILAPDYINSAGASPVARAFEIEEYLGPKTIGVVCVGTGGNFLTAAQIDEFQKYLNGDRTITPPTRGIISSNTEATVLNYIQRPIDVNATVYGGNQTQIVNALTALFSPLKLKSDGVSFQWSFGDEIPLSVIIDAIHNVSPLIRKVTINTPDDNIILGEQELPFPGTMTVSVVP